MASSSGTTVYATVRHVCLRGTLSHPFGKVIAWLRRTQDTESVQAIKASAEVVRILYCNPERAKPDDIREAVSTLVGGNKRADIGRQIEEFERFYATDSNIELWMDYVKMVDVIARGRSAGAKLSTMVFPCILYAFMVYAPPADALVPLHTRQ